MLKSILVALMLLLVTPLLISAGPATRPSLSPDKPVTVRTGMVPIGELGIPLGQLVLLEGVKAAEGLKVENGEMIVEKLDGKPLASPVGALIDNLTLPETGKCIVRGYETMRMIGDAPAYAQLAKLKNEPRPKGAQAGWQIQCYFVAVDVVSPASLTIDHPN